MTLYLTQQVAIWLELLSVLTKPSLTLTQTNFLPYYRSETSEEKTEELRKNIELAGGYPQIESSSDFYCNTIVIPDLKMVWNDKMHAFVSVGKIGLGNFGSHVVNKYVTGCVVFDRRLGNITYYFQDDMFQAYLNYNSGDGLRIDARFLEPTEICWTECWEFLKIEFFFDKMSFIFQLFVLLPLQNRMNKKHITQ